MFSISINVHNGSLSFKMKVKVSMYNVDDTSFDDNLYDLQYGENMMGGSILSHFCLVYQRAHG